MNIPARCPKCRRILFPTKENKIPWHLVPPAVRLVVNTDSFGSARLTGPGDPMCKGSDEPVRKRTEDELTGDAYRDRLRRKAKQLRRNRSRSGSKRSS